jgi:superoxide dismutase, Fe-Mn family
MIYESKKYEGLFGLSGLSDTLLKNHFTLYEGYVKNVNILVDLSKTLKPGSPEYNELRRRFGWEWNGMRLHELYFENLTKEFKDLDKENELTKGIITAFGSYENWMADFKILGLTRGIGWAVLVKDKNTGALMNIWIGEHDVGHLAGTDILLIMDVFEHSYLTDYGVKRADYIDKFIFLIDWETVEKRFNR